MADESIYRCVNPGCARLMPRPVKFCPWCGTKQGSAQAPAPAAGPDAAAQAAELRRAVEAGAAATAAAELSGWSDAPAPPLPSAPEAASSPEPHAANGAAAARAGLAGAGAGVRAGADAGAGSRADAPARARGLGSLFGYGARERTTPPPQQPVHESVPRPPIPPRPLKPQREPIRLRYWVLVLAILWGVWLLARPNSARKIQGRIDHAVALAQDCKAREAQDELIALRKTRATDAQLERLQGALNEGAAACTRKRQRDRAWSEAAAAAETALTEGNPDRARARLQAFTRRYGDDDRSRALRQRIEDARHPLAAPTP